MGEAGRTSEWITADQHGLFAMGTRTGARTRKYHGFLCGVAGGLEKLLLAQIGLECHGRGLWENVYASNSAPVLHPRVEGLLTSFSANPWPAWVWTLPEGKLSASLSPLLGGGFVLRLFWDGQTAAPLRATPLWAMRPLHGLGGKVVHCRLESDAVRFRSAHENVEAFITTDAPADWQPEQVWYKRFYYAEEQARGYDCLEDLYSAGRFEVTLRPGESIGFYLSIRPKPDRRVRPVRHPLAEYILQAPPGIIAGFPWFGEWGRDTFISLPGVFAGICSSRPADCPALGAWALELLDRWSCFTRKHGMLPNVMTADGPQWDSADATLWWTHALASLWSFAVARPSLGISEPLARRFLPRLDEALCAIREGRHRFLTYSNSDELLRVDGDHTTWMDARLQGKAATPRNGVLPEINALWLQARCLRSLWSKEGDKSLITAADHLLGLPLERERCNFVFLYSLPLAPSRLAPKLDIMRRDADALAARLATPVGLRTLAPDMPGYKARYAGDQQTRDACYHQGPAWGWLLGHYRMACARFRSAGIEVPSLAPAERISTIDGHFAELFDGEPPWHPQGAPAQAWSLACAAEADASVAWQVDLATQRFIEEIQ